MRNHLGSVIEAVIVAIAIIRIGQIVHDFGVVIESVTVTIEQIGVRVGNAAFTVVGKAVTITVSENTVFKLGGSCASIVGNLDLPSATIKGDACEG